MEYMNIEGFLGGAISKLINKSIENKTGYKPKVMLEQFQLKTGVKADTDEQFVYVTAELAMSQGDFEKLIEEATK